ncbi:MAG: CHAT domain-containing protein [Planctomycetes bacterium]|nr:CHAT domain-containing protein [Planctomycetota bacterium]
MSKRYEVRIEFKRAGGEVFVDLRDDRGNGGFGMCRLAAHRGLDAELRRYRRLECDVPELRALGRRLLDEVLLAERDLRDAWQRILGAAGNAPLHVTAAFGPDTPAAFALPLELLADERGFLFARDGSSLVRELLLASPRPRGRPMHPRVLLAWAAPEGTVPFDPGPHRAMLEAVFGHDAVAVLDDVTPTRLRDALATRPADHLHLMVHGGVDWDGPHAAVAGDRAAQTLVTAQRLADAVRGTGLSFAFLCMCSSAELGDHGLFDGIAQALIAEHGGDLPVVVAQQAPLPIRGSAALAADFYRVFAKEGDPATAIAALRARHAGERSDLPAATWSVPVLLVRPEAGAGLATGVAAPLAHFVGRAAELEALSRAAFAHEAPPLIALLGIGGLGKTSILNHWLFGAARRGSPPFDAIVPFCAYHAGSSFRAFLELLLRALGEAGIVDEERMAAAISRAAELLGEKRVLVAIDGLEAWLRGWKDGIERHEAQQQLDRDEGPVHRGLNEFLLACAGLENGSRLVFSSRALPLALDSRRLTILGSGGGERDQTLRGLRTADGVELLRRLAVLGDDAALAECVDDFAGHPLLLTVFAAQHRGETITRGASRAAPAALRAALDAAHGNDDAPAADLAVFDRKLFRLLDGLEHDRARDVPLLQAIAACVADAPRVAIAHALELRPHDRDLANRLLGLECWGLLERYELADGTWLALHPLVKQHFRREVPKAVDRALGEWFGKQPVSRASCTLREAEPRIWAIQHFLRAGDFDRCWAILTAELAGGKPLCDWFYAWGYLEYEIEIERQLLERCSPRLRSEIRRSLAHNYLQLGDIDQALALEDGESAEDHEAQT